MTDMALQIAGGAVICIFGGGGIYLIYRWCGQPSSWPKEAGSLIKARRNVLVGTFIFSALLGVLMDFIAHSFPGYSVIGCGLGVLAGPQMSKRLNATALKMREIDSSGSTAHRGPAWSRWMIYCMAYAGALFVCAWEYFVSHLPGRVLLVDASPVFVFLTALILYLRWSKRDENTEVTAADRPR